ncbi:uncharacterized protein LOC106058223 isoform X7 [Biomphalaria glabrata]|uniref:Uncharacterized protein LOC106058223 isoform X7 n=1 Tax=Biomphalaria glabrata TaxID=6526 RepID=A0A9W2YVV0_BIOGL|nr:uncharacterized protein LOC106058223 isoform X7 [Biomphalaria glabrata]
MRACFLLYVLCIFRIKASIKIRCGIGEIRGKGDIFLELSYWSKDITYCILTKDDGVHEKTVLHFDRYDEYNSFDSESKWNMCVKLLQKHYNSFSANVTFSNVSNNHATKWTFKCNVLSSKAVYTDSCNLKIFERPSNVECDPQYSPTLNLVCTAVGMFNNSKCTFYVTLNNSDHYEQTNISYGNKDGKPRCSLHLQSVDVGTEYNITVTIYPNVTGNDTDIQFGSSKTFTDDGQQITAYTTMNNSMFSPTRAFMLLLIVSSTLVLVSASLTTYALRKYKDYIVLCEKGISYRRLRKTSIDIEFEVINIDNTDIYRLKKRRSSTKEDVYCTIQDMQHITTNLTCYE